VSGYEVDSVLDALVAALDMEIAAMPERGGDNAGTDTLEAWLKNHADIAAKDGFRSIRTVLFQIACSYAVWAKALPADRLSLENTAAHAFPKGVVVSGPRLTPSTQAVPARTDVTLKAGDWVQTWPSGTIHRMHGEKRFCCGMLATKPREVEVVTDTVFARRLICVRCKESGSFAFLQEIDNHDPNKG
jgi:hypothetical protein